MIKKGALARKGKGSLNHNIYFKNIQIIANVGDGYMLKRLKPNTIKSSEIKQMIPEKPVFNISLGNHLFCEQQPTSDTYEKSDPIIDEKVNKIKQLRELTGLGLMDCKKLLSSVDFDMNDAIEKSKHLTRFHIMR